MKLILLLVNDDMVYAVEEIITENKWFILSLSLHFPFISCSLLHKIMSETLNYWELCAHWVLKMQLEEHKMKCQDNIFCDIIARGWLYQLYYHWKRDVGVICVTLKLKNSSECVLKNTYNLLGKKSTTYEILSQGSIISSDSY